MLDNFGFIKKINITVMEFMVKTLMQEEQMLIIFLKVYFE